MNQRRPGANSGMFSGLEGASHRIKNPKSRFGFLAAARGIASVREQTISTKRYG